MRLCRCVVELVHRRSADIDQLGGGSRIAQNYRGEAQFDKWSDVPGQQVIVKLVDLGPVINRLAVLDSDSTEHIVENRIEPNAAKPEFVGDGLELQMSVVMDQSIEEVRADRQLEEAIERLGRPSNIKLDVALSWFSSLRRCGGEKCKQGQDATD